MTHPAAVLVAHLALLSLISFGGMPGVLPDLHDFVVTSHGWISNQDFANSFAVVQAIPGPNMILLTSFIGWKVGGVPIAMAAALATFGPSCTLAFAVFRWWDRFRDRAWQQRLRRGLAPMTVGLVLAGGYAMARSGDVGPAGVAVTIAAIGIVLGTRLNPLWLIAAGGALGASGLL
ncbi:MAG TPA: chromate transporter [Stellaceae bacterium]|nr:chromate transporter [Stellaceae bacterium]